MTVLENYVILSTGVPATLHFYDHTIVPRTITDPVTLKPAARQALVMEVDELDGRTVSAKFSIMAEKLAAIFGPYLPDKSYISKNFIITKTGEGFLTSWNVIVNPRK
jgi:hypothetical protein